MTNIRNEREYISTDNRSHNIKWIIRKFCEYVYTQKLDKKK